MEEAKRKKRLWSGDAICCFSRVLSLSLTHTHTPTHTNTLMHRSTHKLTLFLWLSNARRHTHTFSLQFSSVLLRSNYHTSVLCCWKRFFARILFPPLSLSLSLSLSFFLISFSSSLSLPFSVELPTIIWQCSSSSSSSSSSVFLLLPETSGLSPMPEGHSELSNQACFLFGSSQPPPSFDGWSFLKMSSWTGAQIDRQYVQTLTFVLLIFLSTLKKVLTIFK